MCAHNYHNTINKPFEDDLPDETLQVVDIVTFITVQQLGNQEQASNTLKEFTTNCGDTELNNYTIYKETINALQASNPLDTYPEVDTPIAQLEKEQEHDAMLIRVRKWIEQEAVANNNIFSTREEKNYLEQLAKLLMDNGLLKRNYYQHSGRSLNRQLCVPKHMLKETLYRSHISSIGGHIDKTRKIADIEIDITAQITLKGLRTASETVLHVLN